MSTNWVRRAIVTGRNIRNNNAMAQMSLLYHFLRVLGWKLVWEGGDAETVWTLNTNHCPDGNMDDSGVTNWAVVGTGTRSKITGSDGPYALQIDAAAADDGVRSANFTDLFWAGNSTIADAQNAVEPNDDYFTDLGVTFPEDIGTNRANQLTISGFSNPGNNGSFVVYSDPTVSLARLYTETELDATETDQTVDWAVDEPYEIWVKARNSSGHAWTVEVDNGDGSPASVGTIPDNSGVSTLHRFSFTLEEGNNSVFLRFVDTTGGGTLIVDSVNVHYSHFENSKHFVGSGIDGALGSTNQFSSASYVPGADDVGKFLFIADSTYPENAGVYKITGDIGGGTVSVDLQSTTMAFSASTGLTFRIVDLDSMPQGLNTKLFFNGAGYVLESPHTSNWRFGQRHFRGTYSGVVTYHAPTNTAVDASTGYFRSSGPSTQRFYSSQNLPTDTNNFGDHGIQLWHPGYHGDNLLTYDTHSYIKTDDDGSYISYYRYHSHGQYELFIVGDLGADAYHSGHQAFGQFGRWDQPGDVDEAVEWGLNNQDISSKGCTFAGEALADAEPIETWISSSGYAGSGVSVQEQSNAGPNPWSGGEQPEKLPLMRDPVGNRGKASLRSADIGVYHIRENMADYTIFDSNNKIHLHNGLAWDWNGEDLS